MSALWGLVGGVGLLLIAAPFLWPRRQRAARPPRPPSRLAMLLAAAGLERVSPAAFVAVSVVLALAAGALAVALTAVLPLAAAVTALAALAPLTLLRHRVASLARERRLVWPDVVDHLTAAVRAGVALPEAVAALADTGPEPTRDGFRVFALEYSSSASFGRAVDRAKERLADPVADRLLETLRMAREVGGNELSTVLRALAAHLRQEQAVRSEAEARQSWLVNAARLGVAAPWVVLLLLASRPEAAAAYNSGEGVLVIAGGAALTVVAYRLMMRLGRLPVEARWFR